MCGRQNNGPKDLHVLIPGTRECVTLAGKEELQMSLSQGFGDEIIRVGPVWSPGSLHVKDRRELASEIKDAVLLALKTK